LTMTQNKWPISPRGGHDDAKYEHTFVGIVSCDDFRFNDTLTRSDALLSPLLDPLEGLSMLNCGKLGLEGRSRLSALEGGRRAC
jgi:hypothetical protein